MVEERKLVTQAEFARLLGVDKAHVTRLKQAERLVMEGKLVDVEASKARIAQTADPAHADKGSGKTASATFNEARAREMAAKADMAEMEAAEKAGRLVDAEEARLFAANVGATFRSQLEALADRLAPELAPISDVDEVRALLVENHEAVLLEVSRMIEKGMGQ